MLSPHRFSLTEGLILVVILGTLAAHALPLRQRAVEAANLAKCRSNLFEVGVASHLYASEHGGRLLGPIPDPSPSPFPSVIEGTYIGDGRMYGALVTPAFGGYGQRDYLGRVHPPVCPSFPEQIYNTDPLYKRPEEITETNKMIRTGYIWMFRPYSRFTPQLRANDTIHGNPHSPLMFDFGPILSGPAALGHPIACGTDERPSPWRACNDHSIGGSQAAFHLECPLQCLARKLDVPAMNATTFNVSAVNRRHFASLGAFAFCATFLGFVVTAAADWSGATVLYTVERSFDLNTWDGWPLSAFETKTEGYRELLILKSPVFSPAAPAAFFRVRVEMPD